MAFNAIFKAMGAPSGGGASAQPKPEMNKARAAAIEYAERNRRAGMPDHGPGSPLFTALMSPKKKSP